MGPIAIIDYGAGNLRSVQKAFERLGYPAQFVSSPGELDSAAAVVFLLDHSEEGDTPALGIVPGYVRRFNSGLKVPHMGWNSVALRQPHPLFDGVPEESYFYFVHSYYAAPDDPSWIAGETTYGIGFASFIARGNVVATQFHPEKSGAPGLMLYDNFVKRLVRERG